MTDQNQNPKCGYPTDKPITIHDLFHGNLDDLEEYFEQRMRKTAIHTKTLTAGQKIGYYSDVRDVISDANFPGHDSMLAYVAHLVKYVGDKKCRQLGMKLAYDLLPRKDRMILGEHFSDQILYLVGMIIGVHIEAIKHIGKKYPSEDNRDKAVFINLPNGADQKTIEQSIENVLRKLGAQKIDQNESEDNKDE